MTKRLQLSDDQEASYLHMILAMLIDNKYGHSVRKQTHSEVFKLAPPIIRIQYRGNKTVT